MILRTRNLTSSIGVDVGVATGRHNMIRRDVLFYVLKVGEEREKEKGP